MDNVPIKEVTDALEKLGREFEIESDLLRITIPYTRNRIPRKAIFEIPIIDSWGKPGKIDMDNEENWQAINDEYAEFDAELFCETKLQIIETRRKENKCVSCGKPIWQKCDCGLEVADWFKEDK